MARSPTKRPALNERRTTSLKTAVRVLRAVVKQGAMSPMHQGAQARAEIMVAIAFIESTIGAYAPKPEAQHTGDRRNGV